MMSKVADADKDLLIPASATGTLNNDEWNQTD